METVQPGCRPCGAREPEPPVGRRLSPGSHIGDGPASWCGGEGHEVDRGWSHGTDIASAVDLRAFEGPGRSSAVSTFTQRD